MLENKNQNMKKEFFRYALPSVIGMVMSSLYSIVDGIFVGRGVGETALAAVNIVYPFLMLQIALSMLFAIGGANHFSSYKGKNDFKSANSSFLHSIYFLSALSIIINLTTILFPAAVGRILGADDELLPYVIDYIKWVALFGILYMPGLGISIFIRNDNAPGLEMIGTLGGAITNIVLDYLFIMVFQMGIAGAAIATGIGQMVSCGIYMLHFTKKDRLLRFAKLKLEGKKLKAILLNGTPSFLMEFSQSAITYSFNIAILSKIGSIGVSSYSVVMYICSIFNMVLVGIVQGAQPIMSFNFGQKNYGNIRKIYKMGIVSNLCLSAFFYGIILLFGKYFVSLFVPGNEAVSQMSVSMMRYYFLAFFPIGISLMNILYFQVTRKETQSILLSFLRCIGFVQLSLLILPNIWGITGLYLSFFCGELVNCFLSSGLYAAAKKRYRREKFLNVKLPEQSDALLAEK